MLNFDPAILNKFEAETTFEADLISFTVSGDYITNSDHPVYHNGNKHRVVPFEMPEITGTPGMNVDLIEIKTANADLFFTSYFLNVDRRGDEVLLGKYFTPGQNSADYIQAYIENWQLNGNRCQIILTTEFALWKKKTLRYPNKKCPWPFKISTECGYSGTETWCDRTEQRCKSLNNYANFGGRKYIQTIENKKIYWGPEGT